VAKALVTEPRVLILDEPTSALDSKTAEVLLDILRVLRDRQVAVVFVSHILEEVMQLCDEVTVLRDGRTVLDAAPLAGLTIPKIVEAMLGERHAELAEVKPRATVDLSGTVAAPQGSGVLRVEGVSVEDRLVDVSVTAAPGEVVGLAVWPAPATRRCSSWWPDSGSPLRDASCCPTAPRRPRACGPRSRAAWRW
jgi:ABC-type sugar transport system ATPase subunit